MKSSLKLPKKSGLNKFEPGETQAITRGLAGYCRNRGYDDGE